MRLPTYEDLSKEQDRIYDLPLEGSYLIIGPPGSGKTVLALHRAKRMNDSDRAVKVLMYHNLLRQFTERAIANLDIDAITDSFWSWFPRFYRSLYRFPPFHIDQWKLDWVKILQKFQSKPPPKGKVGHLIVDEGQDLPREFYLIASHVSSDLTVFADENQVITEDNSTIQDIKVHAGIKGPIMQLRRNYRNTREIAQLASHFYTGDSPTGIAEMPERSGPDPELRWYPKPRPYETVQWIAAYESSHTDLQIGVLVPSHDVQKTFWNRLCGKTSNQVQMYVGDEADFRDVDWGLAGIKIVTYASAKGLEFDTVFIPELQAFRQYPSMPDVRMRFYVLISRARQELYLSFSGEGEPAILTLFKPAIEQGHVQLRSMS
jgi:superfamily I DNA/RNA helicase